MIIDISNPDGYIAVFSFANMYKVEIDHGTFAYNRGSVIEAFNSIIKLEGNNTFSNNTALHGGAISLSALSHLLLHNQHSTFINNRALTFGGAIYIDGSVRENSCGFQIDGSFGSIDLVLILLTILRHYLVMLPLPITSTTVHCTKINLANKS